MKNRKKKVVTFLPFLIGGVLYASYTALWHLSFKYVLDNYVGVMEHGFAVGALSTVVYVLYEQFVRDEKQTNPHEAVIATLIEGYVPSDGVESVAAEIASAIEKDVTGEGAKKTAEILAANSSEDVTEKDVKLLAKLIIETLAHLNVS